MLLSLIGRILIVITSSIIIYQDFKSRLISLAWLLAFIVFNLLTYCIEYGWELLLGNFLFCLGYGLLCYLAILLYFFIKTKKIQPIMDSKLGWGDALVFLGIGPVFEPELMIVFFTFAFIGSLLIHAIFRSEKKTVPLAGYMLLFYLAYLSAHFFTAVL